MKLRFCCAIKDSQLLFIELIIRTHIEKHSVGLSPLNFLFLARSPNEKWFAIEITRKYEKLSQRAYNKFKTNLKLLSVEGRLLPDKMESSTAALGMAARGGRLHLSWLIQFYKNPSSPSLNLKIAGNAVFTKPIDF